MNLAHPEAPAGDAGVRNRVGCLDAPPQLPGCLPQGFGLDSLLTVEEFATFTGQSVRAVKDALPTMRGVLRGSKRMRRKIHVGTYLHSQGISFRKAMEGVR